MQVIHGLDDVCLASQRPVLTVGNFDGVHRGHRQIVITARRLAARSGRAVVALTFEPHPLSVLTPDRAPQRLGTPEQKLALLGGAGVDLVVVARSTMAFLALAPEAFVGDVIVRRFQPTHIVEGRNFGFGKGRRGSVETLAQLSSHFNYELHVVEPVLQALNDGSTQRISSSLIRQLLLEGRVELAAEALGRPYCFAGKVVKGADRGRPLGFPTANLEAIEQLVPADGVYAAAAEVNGQSFRCAVSIGTTPTFDGHARQVEAHLLDFDGDLYGQWLTLHLRRWLRPQRKFDSKQQLVQQIRSDVDQVRKGACNA